MKRSEKLEWNKKRFTEDGRTRKPWRVDKIDDYAFHIVGFDGQSVATVLGGSAGFLPQRMANDYIFHNEVTLNNAKLVASAPDMYQLLTKIVNNDVQDLMDKYPVSPGFYSAEFAVVSAVRALLERINSDYYMKKEAK